MFTSPQCHPLSDLAVASSEGILTSRRQTVLAARRRSLTLAAKTAAQEILYELLPKDAFTNAVHGRAFRFLKSSLIGFFL